MDSMIDQDQLCFAQPFTMTLAGGRRTGKTYFTKTLLERNRHLLSSPTLETIIWFYGTSQQSIFDELIVTMQEYGQRIEFVQGLPQDKTVQDFIGDFPGQQKLIVLDDLMEKASNRPDVAALFTHGRHEHVSVMYLTQKSLNNDYAVLFKNTRNLSMITHLGQQMGNVKFLKQAYQAATIDPFSHLFIDMRSDTPEIIRYRSNVLDEIQTVYHPV